ncbi:MAG: M48 family metallopeptidase [Burkholderiales bacterium]|nr:M48 family metallopeptidase [Burkholderiales bacterium]
MNTVSFSFLFAAMLLATLGVKLWLSARQLRHVAQHRDHVPAQFAQKIPLAAHQKAADYTIAKTQFNMILLVVNTAVLVGFTLLGGLQWLSEQISYLAGDGMVYQLGLIVAVMLISSVIDLPFDYYKQFTLEEKFGFNKMKPALFFTDLIKNTVVSALIGLPLIWVILSVMEKAGDLWWLYAWGIWCVFQIFMLAFYQSVIAPLFNKFTPLEDTSLQTRIEGLMQRVGFASKGLFVMDGSRRSAHGNAYFSGFGAAKRIVFFDTLLARLAPSEIEAVLAHELGHFKLRHVIQRIAIVFALSLGFLALLGYLKNQLWFYQGLGVNPMLNASNDAMVLILFMLSLPVFTFLLSPLTSIRSRKQEFEADAFAAKHSNAQDLISALVKLYEDNASTLTPDPLHSAFYDSHPPASIRVQRLLTQ